MSALVLAEICPYGEMSEDTRYSVILPTVSCRRQIRRLSGKTLLIPQHTATRSALIWKLKNGSVLQRRALSTRTSVWLGGVTVRTLDSRSTGRGFNCRSGCYQVVSWTGDWLRTGKPSRYITNTTVNSAFHDPSLRGRWIKAWLRLLCPVSNNTVWSHMAGDAP